LAGAGFGFGGVAGCASALDAPSNANIAAAANAANTLLAVRVGADTIRYVIEDSLCSRRFITALARAGTPTACLDAQIKAGA
jgi:hypothetical protein